MLEALLNGTREAIWRLPDGLFCALNAPNAPAQFDGSGMALLPGSFNPLHVGHVQLAKVAAAKLACDVYFELSVANVDKPPLDTTEILRRCAQFGVPLLLTHAPTFVRKTEIVGAATFVVGADTAERIVQHRYYGSIERMHAALEHMRDRGVRFLVAGRATGSEFLRLANITLQDEFATMFTAISESDFRHDVSSTQLRET